MSGYAIMDAFTGFVSGMENLGRSETILGIFWHVKGDRGSIIFNFH